MERLAAKKRKGVLGTLGKDRRFSSTAPRSAGVGGYGTPEHIKELETGKDAADTATPVSETKATPVSEPKATTAEERADLEKKYGSFEGAKRAIAAEGARYREALQSPDAWKRDIDASRMAEFGDVGDVVGAKDSGFEERYDADVKFQEEEYGEGSLEREDALSEILGEGWRTERESPRREDLIEKGRYAFDELYEEAKAANPEGREEDWQDAAIKAYHRSKAEDAAEFARTFEVEDTAQVSGKMEDYAAKRAAELREARLKREAAAKKKQTDIAKAAVEKAKKTGPGGAGTRKQPTDTERAAQKALGKTTTDEVEETTTDEVEETTTDEVIENTVDETSTEESIDAAARKEQAKDSKEATEREALDAGFANVRMPGLRKQSSELYNSFDKAYSSMYPSQEEMNSNPGARRRLVQRRNALDTIKNKLFRSSPDQWGNRPYGTGMNLDDAIQALENELPTATKQIKQMARRMRGFHILMNRYGEDAQLKGAFDLENLLRNTRLRGEKPLEESGEVLRPIRTEGSLDDSPVEEIIASAVEGS